MANVGYEKKNITACRGLLKQHAVIANMSFEKSLFLSPLLPELFYDLASK